MRNDGLYWVKQYNRNGWILAKWCNASGKWTSGGVCVDVYDVRSN